MKFNKKISLIIVSILIGLLLPHTELYLIVVLILGFSLIIIIPLFLIGFVIYLISEIENKTKLSTILKVIFQVGFPIILFISSIVFSEIGVENYNRNKVEKIIIKLEDYKIENHSYPDKIESIYKQSAFWKINYTFNSKSKNYRIGYYRNSFVRIEYDNETKLWNSYGWND